MKEKRTKKALIIGSGIGGIATAIRLRCLGFDVTVFEANSYPGGKLTQMEVNGYRFDCGPSLFTMPQFVHELFDLAKKPIAPYFNYTKKETVCNYFYTDGTRFSAKASTATFAKDAATTFKVSETQVTNYFEKSKKKYDLTASLFLEKSLHRLQTYLSRDTIKALFQLQSLDLNQNLHTVNANSFEDARLVQLFDRFATYNGSSPYQTPGIMSMIPHLEQHYGTFFPNDGMHSITQSLYQLALDLGAKFQFNRKVDKILVQQQKATGIQIANESVFADLVISNADIVPTYRKLLTDQKAPEKTLQQERSSSALIFYWGIKATFPELDLHNIFFSEYYKSEFQTLFETKTLSNDPTVYLNISCKNKPNDAPEGCENWFVMINVPNNQGQNWDLLIKQAKKSIVNKLSGILQKDIAPLIATESILDPRGIEQKTQSYQGSLYGAASNSKFAAFLRHPNFSQKIKNLYFCGGSVHPGGGIPLCLLSAKIVADLIQKNNPHHPTT